MDRQEKQDIVRAIVSCRGQVSCAEVALQTGLPLVTVNRCLNSMAYDCGAHLRVSSDGTLTYLFPPHFEILYRMGSLQKFAGFLLTCLERAALFAIKFTVGALLTVSVTFFYTIAFLVLEIMAVFTNMEAPTANMRREFFDIMKALIKAPGKTSLPGKKARLPAFIENCFGLLFGPQNPNASAENDSWRHLVRTIREGRGVVIGEQMRVWSLQDDEESFDLKVLVRLDGMPSVTESGTILYQFPALAKALNEEEKPAGKQPAFLQEKVWHFSGVETKDLIPVLALAVVNLLGCNFAYFALHALPAVGKSMWLYGFITLLWMYGNTFLAFPLARIFMCAYRNHCITVRNVTRKLLAESLLYPSAETGAKLEEARQCARELCRENESSSVVFTTESDSLSQFIEETPTA